MFENERFETFLFDNPYLKSLSKHMFLVWDGNHKLQVWLPYINCLHNDEPSWHISMDSIIFDTSHGPIELLPAMMELSKYVLDPYFVSHIKARFKGFFSHFFMYLYKLMKLDHVKPSLVHEFF